MVYLLKMVDLSMAMLNNQRVPMVFQEFSILNWYLISILISSLVESEPRYNSLMYCEVPGHL